MSNVNTFKYNGLQSSAKKLEGMGTITSTIRKISPTGIQGPIGGNHNIHNG
jgi:hypothetical protein